MSAAVSGNPLFVESYAEIAIFNTRLLSYEARWRDKQPFLASRGYQLRSRYHPSWVPLAFSGANPLLFDDFWQLNVCIPWRDHR